MIVPDVNLLLYAYDAQSPLNPRARQWLEATLSGAETIGFPWLVLLAFARLATSRTIFDEPLNIDQAVAIMRSWLAQPNAVTLEPTDRHLYLMAELLRPLGTAGNLTTDAHLAAIAIGHGADLHSADTDFGRFPRLRWHNPLT